MNTSHFVLRPISGVIVALMLWVIAPSHAALAQEKAAPPAENKAEAEAPKTDAPPADKPADQAKTDAPPDKPKPGLADQLLDQLIDKAKEQAANPLDAIVERMRAAQQKLQKTETDQETRDLQTRIVKDLDELIEKLKNQKPPPKSNQNQPPPPPPMGDSSQNPPPRGGSQPKPQNSQKQRGGAEQQQKQQEGSSAASQAEKARESSNQTQGQPRTPEEEAARQRLAKDVWGHLPPALRQQLLNVYSEKFLPKYDDLVRKYYEALAEQNRKNP